MCSRTECFQAFFHGLWAPFRPAMPRSGGLPLGCGDFAGLQDLLQAPQIIFDLRFRFLAEELGDDGAQRANRGHVIERHAQDSAALAGSSLETDRARALHISGANRTPRDQLVGLVLDNLRIPLQLHASRPFYEPVRMLVVDFTDDVYMSHEAGEVLEI